MRTRIAPPRTRAAADRIGARAEPFLAFVTSASLVLRQFLRWLIALTPIGSAALLADAVVNYGWDALSAPARRPGLMNEHGAERASG